MENGCQTAHSPDVSVLVLFVRSALSREAAPGPCSEAERPGPGPPLCLRKGFDSCDLRRAQSPRHPSLDSSGLLPGASNALGSFASSAHVQGSRRVPRGASTETPLAKPPSIFCLSWMGPLSHSSQMGAAWGAFARKKCICVRVQPGLQGQRPPQGSSR